MSTSPAPELRTRSDRLWFAGVCLGMLALYVSTLCPTVYWYDSAEFATAAALLGIPHPPGYPVYTLLGKLYVLLTPGEPAFAVNLMSAVHGALCVGLVFLLQRRLQADHISALCGALFFGTGPSFWFNCNVAEVYTTGLLVSLLVWLLLFDGIESGRRSLLLMAALVGGIGFATHMFVATLGLGYVLLVWHGTAAPSGERVSRLSRLRTLGLAAVAALLGACAYLYIPLRLAMRPALSFLKVNTPASFFWMLSGGPYSTLFAPKHERPGRLLGVLSMLDDHLTDLGLVLGVVGLCVLIARQRVIGLALLLAVLGDLAFFFDYDVHDLEVFFLPAAALLCVCIGPLLTSVRGALVNKPSTRLVANVALGVCLAYVALRLSLVAPTVDLANDRSAQHYGESLVAVLPRDAIILIVGTPDEWKFRTVFDYYFQKVLGQRPDVLAIDVPGQIPVGIKDGSWAAGRLPPLLRNVFDSGRPVYMYKEVEELAPLVAFAPEGLLVRVRAR
jgi:hypothetical protein